MSPDLSIVIVSWNTRDLLEKCLVSVLSGANNPALEIWVVDNASSDGSAEMVRQRFPGVRLIANTANRGFAPANNQALREATGRYLLLLNPDTEVLGAVLARSVAYLDDNPEVGILGCRTLNPDLTLQPNCFMEPSLLNLGLNALGLHRLPWPAFFGRERLRGWNCDSEREVEAMAGCFLMARRKAVEAVGLLDDSFFFYAEETDWCRRFRAAGWKVRFAPVGEIIHVGGASSAQLDCRKLLLLAEALVRYRRKHGGRVSALLAWSLLGFGTFLRWLGRSLKALGSGRPSKEARELGQALKRWREAWPAPGAGR